MTHSILPPSSAARRVACPGSRFLESLYQGEQNESAKEGHAAHWVAAELLRGATIKEGDVSPEGVTITEEMITGGLLYSDVVSSIVNVDSTVTKNIEKQIKITSIHPECFGTPDLWFFTKNESGECDLYIFDYKYGFSNVEAFENWQLIEYSAGILEMYDINNVTVHFYIIQPRCYSDKIKSWNIKATKLGSYYETLRKAEHLAINDNAPLQPSPECKNCKARHACKALQQSALSVVEESYSFEFRNDKLGPVALGSELRLLHHFKKILDARINGLEAEAIERLKRSEQVTFYKLEQGYGRERWNTEPEKVIALSDLYGVKVTKPVELITPKQAVKAGLPAEVVKKYSETPKGELKLVVNDARKLFGGA